MNSRSTILHRQHRPGFTLIEILVVIVIIVALAAISYTAFRTIRATANESISASNMRQIGIAIQTYVADKGRYHGDLPGTEEYHVAWDRTFMPYLADPNFDFKSGGTNAIREKTPEAAAAKTALTTLYCPGDKTKAPSGQFIRSYAMCPWTVTQGGPGFRNGFKLLDVGTGPPPSKIDDPASAVVLIEFQSRPDSQFKNIVGTGYYDYLFGFRPLGQDPKPANYHKQNQLLLFVDGHVAQCPGNITQAAWQKKGYSPHIDPITGSPK